MQYPESLASSEWQVKEYVLESKDMYNNVNLTRYHMTSFAKNVDDEAIERRTLSRIQSREIKGTSNSVKRRWVTVVQETNT